MSCRHILGSMSNNRSNGFGLIALLVVLVVAAGIAFGWYAYHTGGITNILKSAKKTAVVTGIVTSGPITPVCRAGESCISVVSNHTIELEDANGVVAASAKTNDNGLYVLNVYPGTYTLVLVPKIGLGAGKQVTVKSGMNNVDYMVDSGLR